MKIAFGKYCPCCGNGNRHRDHRTGFMRLIGIKKLYVCTKCRMHYVILFGGLGIGLGRCPKGAKYWKIKE